MKDLKEQLDTLPSSPGVYLFKDSAGEVIYVGKSANIRARVRSYFRGETTHPTRAKLREEIAAIETKETQSEIAALVREAALIKKLKPRFNVLMRDSKNYVYVGITREDFPRIIVTHQPRTYNLKPITYVGPFTDARAVKKTLRILRRIFPYYTKRSHSRVAKQIGIVPPDDISKKEYRKNVFAIKRILTGRSKKVQRQLTKEIAHAARNQEFERAKKLRDTLEYIRTVVDHAHVLGSTIAAPPVFADTTPNWEMLGLAVPPERIEAYDISNIQGEQAVGSMIVFSPTERGYAPDTNEYRKFKIRTVEGANEPAMMHETLTRRLQHPEWPFPDLIVIDGGKAQLNAVHDLTQEHDIPTIALAKREEEVYFPSRKDPVRADRFGQQTKQLLQAMRDETHRFGLSYHRTLRTKAVFDDAN